MGQYGLRVIMGRAALMRFLMIGASGGTGAALADALEAKQRRLTRIRRGTNPKLELEDEDSIA